MTERTEHSIPPSSEGEHNTYDFWKDVVETLDEIDTGKLRAKLLDRVKEFPQLASPDSLASINHGIKVATEAHNGQFRELTGRPYINHPLQVALLGIKLMDPSHVSVDSVNTLLLHDTVEDTEMTPKQLEKAFNKRTAAGVVAMSHTHNGGPKLEIVQYLGNMQKFHGDDPTLGILYGKVADFIINANDPRTPDQLSTFDLVNSWYTLKRKKISQMKTFRSFLPEDPHLRPMLEAGIYFTQISHAPGFSIDMLKTGLAAKQRV